MELSRKDTSILKGIAILCMVILHLFATKDITLYTPNYLINGVPATYYLGIMGDACRPIYLFVTGYAFYKMINEGSGSVVKKNLKRILKLYVNVWVVLAIFLPIGLVNGVFTVDITRLILNVLGVENSYNGAWWFVQVYIIFVLFSPVLVGVTKKYRSITLFLIFGFVYFICHIQRYKQIIPLSNDMEVLSKFLNLGVLLGTSIFSFIIGSIFAKEKIFTKLHHLMNRVKFKNVILLIIPILLVLLHATVESSIIAPINGITIICVYMMLKKLQAIQIVLTYFSSHSTNIWLTHMFFYGSIFPEITFAPRHPLLVLLWLLTMCIITSYIIKLITKPLFKAIDRNKFTLSTKKVA